MERKYRVFSVEFKQWVVQRILKGESVTALHRELQIKRTLLYRWRDAYQKTGAAGIARPVGRPPGPRRRSRPEETGEEAAARQIRELKEKIGQQAMDIDFLRRAFKRVKETRQNNTDSGATASIPRSDG